MEPSPRISRIVESGELLSVIPENEIKDPSQKYMFSHGQPVAKNNGYVLAETELNNVHHVSINLRLYTLSTSDFTTIPVSYTFVLSYDHNISNLWLCLLL